MPKTQQIYYILTFVIRYNLQVLSVFFYIHIDLTDHQEYVNLIIIKKREVIITACTTYRTYKVTVIRECHQIILDSNDMTTQWNIVLANIG